MIYLSPEFVQASFSDSIEPRFYCKINNDIEDLYLTSHSDIVIVDANPHTVFSSVINTATAASQDITPEAGISVLGSSQISFADVGFTDKLKEIYDQNETINNNKVELFYGYKGLDVADYAAVQPMWIESHNNDELDYSLVLKDTNRFTQETIFGSELKNEVVSSLGLELGTLEVVSATFEAVAHDGNWDSQPNKEVGYIKITGSDDKGNDLIEYACWEGKTATSYNIIERGVFGTNTINIVGSNDGEQLEIEEVVYLDLPIPKMLIALLTGDLYGQPGKTLPSGWHAGVAANLIDVASFADIGQDLDDLKFEFRDPKSINAKSFIANQVLRLNNLAIIINQQGELKLKRFTAQSINSPSGSVIDYNNIDYVSPLVRDNKNIKNGFRLKWEYRPELEEFKRTDTYIDYDSFNRNNVKSTTELKIEGLRNSGRQAKVVLDSLAQNFRARRSDPSVTRSISGPLKDFIKYEVMDTVTLNLDKEPDYTANNPDLKTFISMEIQKTQFDFLTGTASLNLFGTTGKAGQLSFSEGVSVTDFDRTGWTEITSVLTGSINAGYYEIDDGQTLPSGKYFYLGNLKLPAGRTLNLTGTPVIDCVDFDQGAASIIDGIGGGVVGAQGTFGGGDAAQEGIAYVDKFFPPDEFERKSRQSARIPSSNIDRISYEFSVSKDGKLNGVDGLDLTGNGGSAGDNSTYKTLTAIGGAAVSGGAGLCLIVDNYFFAPDAKVLLHGSDSNIGGFVQSTGGITITTYAGCSGFGWGGQLIILSKDRAAPLPIITFDSDGGLFGSKTGNFATDDIPNNMQPLFSGGSRDYDISKNHVPRYTSAVPFEQQNTDYAPNALYVARLSKQVEAAPEAGIDPVENALPVTLELLEQPNTPLTPNGNVSRVVVTATKNPSDNNFSYAKFQYRSLGGGQWFDLVNEINLETSKDLPSDGTAYEFSAQSVNGSGVVSDQRVIEQITLINISDNTSTSQGNTDEAPENVTVPKVSRLRLINSVGIPGLSNEFKSGNAEFDWAKLSTTRSGDILNPNGALDLHFDGYQVTIKDPQGNIKRELVTLDAFYTYTLEKNIEDGTGRDFSIEVRARANTSFVSEPTTITVSNPAPEAVSNVVLSAGLTTITATFDLPTDIDFVGVQAYIIEGTGDPYTQEPIDIIGNSVTFDSRKTNQVYTVGLKSIDQFGVGGQTVAVGISTTIVEATDIGLITSPLTLDENGGLVITNNSGYQVIHGVISAPPALSDYPFALAAYNGVDYPFWVNINGEAYFTGEVGSGSTVYVGGDTWQSAGIQLEYNAGSPRSYIGDGANDYMQFTIANGLEFGPDTTIGNNNNQTVTVGATGDYTTLNEALEVLSKIVPAYKKGGFTATINVQADWNSNEQVLIYGLDLSWITINFTAPISVTPSGWTSIPSISSAPMFYGSDGAKMPALKGSKVTCTSIGQYAFVASDVGSFYTSSVSNEGFAYGYMAISGSKASIRSAIIEANSRNIVCVDGSNIDISSGAIDGGNEAVYCAGAGSSVSLSLVLITNATQTALNCAGAGSSITHSGDIRNCSTAFKAFSSASIVVTSSEIKDCGASNIESNSFLRLGTNTDTYRTTETTAFMYTADDGGRIAMKDHVFRNGPGGAVGKVLAANGGTITATFAELVGFNVINGSQITATGAVNSTYNQGINSITANGIIYG